MTVNLTELDQQPQDELRSSGLYVDIENLGDVGQEVIEKLVSDWPAAVPLPIKTNLYVPAGQAELWQVWAENLIADAAVTAKGVQRFSSNASKNAADIALSTDAIADYVTGTVSYVVVVSDDSDFISLYTAVRDHMPSSKKSKPVPFLWVVTDRGRTLSISAKKFFPESLMHVVELTTHPADNMTNGPLFHNAEVGREQIHLAETIIREMPVGKFSSTDCKRAIKASWPDHPMLKLDGPQFGIQFTNQIWPPLERRGVKLVGTKPRRYEMTKAVKDSLSP
jgi:hypothetical protein